LPRRRRAPFVALTSLVAALHPGTDAHTAVASGRVLVDGRFVTNPAALVRRDAAVRLLPQRRLRGEVKLAHALAGLDVTVNGRVALDVGASAGGFTTALLGAGARRVYAVDAGVGQMLGSLRADPRVVNLEGRNLGQLDTRLVPEPLGLVTMDLSYLPLADALPQLAPLRLTPDAQLLMLVKPTFELRRPTLATHPEDVQAAVEAVLVAARRCGWAPVGTTTAPAPGAAAPSRCSFTPRSRWGGPDLARRTGRARPTPPPLGLPRARTR
jgi:23S rRNA (cytidine1920-2'-O)/16S rRNA (cytidine1409-2'-O)-methyltransferase